MVNRSRVLLLIIYLSIFLPVIASAHRDGCHRWHSCPSDTGSYVCGDLGYASQCPTYPKPKPQTIQNSIISKIEAAKPSYYTTPHWFRESLIDKINTELGTGNVFSAGHDKNFRMIASLVYALLPDVK